MDELTALLDDPRHPFDFPANRTRDLEWLSRNLAFRNIDNPNFQKAMSLIEELLIKQRSNYA
jgi:hypothetical protein